MRQSCETIPVSEPVPATGAAAAGAPPAPLAVVDGLRPVSDDLAGSVMLLGNFDGFHRGHRALLAEARRVAGRAPVALMAVEPHPRRFFAPDLAPFRLSTPRLTHHRCAEAGLAFVFAPRFDHAFAGQSAEAFVEDMLVARLRIARVVVGEDFRFGRARRGDVALLRAMGSELGFAVTALAPVRRQELVCSSSLVRDLLRAGDVSAANALLGAPWRVEIDVHAVRARELTLGWPDDVLPLPAGDYRARLVAPDRTGDLAGGTLAIRAGHLVFHADRPLACTPLPPHLALDLLGA